MEKLLNVKEMNLAKNGWKTIIATAFAAVSLLCGQSGSTIVLGPIEGELAKKQIALDFEGTQKIYFSLEGDQCTRSFQIGKSNLAATESLFFRKRQASGTLYFFR